MSNKDATGAYIQGGIVGLIIGLVVGFAICRAINKTDSVKAAPTVSTVSVRAPMPTVPDTVIRWVVARFEKPRFDEVIDSSTDSMAIVSAPVAVAPDGEQTDSADVLIPITRRVYEDSTLYRAVVEGYEPRLVSLDIYPRRERERRTRIAIGPSLGLGYDPIGGRVAPIIGVSAVIPIWNL